MTCFICSSLLVVSIPRRSLSKRRNVSEINEKVQEVFLCAADPSSLENLIKKVLFCCLFYLLVKFRDLFLPATLTRNRDLYPHPHPRPLPASRDPRHLDILKFKNGHPTWFSVARFSGFFFFLYFSTDNFAFLAFQIAILIYIDTEISIISLRFGGLEITVIFSFVYTVSALFTFNILVTYGGPRGYI